MARGIASAATQGSGLYVLVAALGVPLQGPGWNVIPPALIYGVVQAGQDFSPQPGMTVTAFVNSKNCGQAQTQALGNDVVYAVDVAANSSQGGCGTAARTVRITVGSKELPNQSGWDNTHATNVSLITENSSDLFMPDVRR